MALKTQFLALHLGQTVVYTGKGRAMNKLGAEVILEPDNLYLCAFLPQRALRLKALSGITNEDCLKVYHMGFNVHRGHSDDQKIEQARYDLSEMGSVHNAERVGWHWLDVWDYLRLRGYALPYAGYDVADLIQLGWVQLQYDPQ